ncbi:MAG: signal peptidase I [Candidatus Zambryskibacteria bacterium RIFOXYC1_FULL_39_10]|uniref:Signal peptidase I n=1 Tax=Candidatus Zambryskibacteria bacterium RIFOXYC1_FULL_39_10 TaxID=1802779 RepID=A0A1G2V2K5_9BACT|nr:MAG: signal peptidase I [Candidatus Zambryskibacteria bacterium RIFOXYC1_FULL_39_10]OHB16921.1 MAG: signal peptidase I [Candidatus Zambryskibacteria bacterium RIFOXYD1_FULL_39_35]
MSKLYKIGYFIFWAIVVCVVVVVLASILPIPGKLEIKIVQSGSMEPTIKVGALAIIRPESLYKVGDIITFGKDTKTDVPTTHRIVADRVENGVLLYTTKGDANEDNDTKEIKKDEIIGKTLFSVPYVGYIIDFAKQPLGFAIFIGLPALYIVYDEVAKIVREVKKIRYKKENV